MQKCWEVRCGIGQLDQLLTPLGICGVAGPHEELCALLCLARLLEGFEAHDTGVVHIRLRWLRKGALRIDLVLSLIRLHLRRVLGFRIGCGHSLLLPLGGRLSQLVQLLGKNWVCSVLLKLFLRLHFSKVCKNSALNVCHPEHMEECRHVQGLRTLCVGLGVEDVPFVHLLQTPLDLFPELPRDAVHVLLHSPVERALLASLQLLVKRGQVRLEDSPLQRRRRDGVLVVPVDVLDVAEMVQQLLHRVSQSAFRLDGPLLLLRQQRIPPSVRRPLDVISDEVTPALSILEVVDPAALVVDQRHGRDVASIQLRDLPALIQALSSHSSNLPTWRRH
eukprot:scaffold340_cov256-Pinguiococcus_pyrenoidosus.AAC.46